MSRSSAMTLEEIRLLVTMIIHDLEKPMAVNTRILGRILDGSIDPRNPAHQRLIRSSWHAGVRLRRMLGDLNDVLDGRHISVRKTPQPVTDLVDAAAREFVPVAEEENIRFTWSCHTRAWTDTDPDIVQRILLNYLYNAAVHTCAGDDIRLEADTGPPNRIVIRVTNSGPVIPEDRLDSLFDPGVQLHLRSCRRWRGHGLGLAFCRMAADALGGHAGAANRAEGSGMEFFIDLPPCPTP